MAERSFATRYAPLLLGVGLIFVLDQYTKYLVRENFSLFESVAVIDGLFNLTYVTNRGAAFGFMAGLDSPWVGRMFVLISFFAMALIVGIYREVEEKQPWLKGSLIAIMGGAVGNLTDRFLAGKVTDFLDFYWNSYHWPAFNVADSCITVGVVVMVVSWFFPVKDDRPTS